LTKKSATNGNSHRHSARIVIREKKILDAGEWGQLKKTLVFIRKAVMALVAEKSEVIGTISPNAMANWGNQRRTGQEAREKK